MNKYAIYFINLNSGEKLLEVVYASTPDLAEKRLMDMQKYLGRQIKIDKIKLVKTI